jgi:hypothetical protein
MKRINTYCFLMLAVIFMFIGTTEAANLLSNPGFENGLNDWQEIWGYPSILSTDQHHNGEFSASKEVGFVYKEYWSQIAQDIDIVPGEPVYGRVYAMSTFNPEGTARAGLMLQFLDANDNVIGTTINSSKIGGKTAWRLLELTAKSAPAKSVKARLSGYLWAQTGDNLSLQKGKAYFDDAYADKRYQPAKPQTALLNQGFENGLNDWTDVYGYPAVVSKTTVHAGIYAARKSVATVATQDYWSELRQEIKCTAGKKVTASVFAKTTMNVQAKAKAGLQISLLNASNKVLKSYSKGIGGQTDWKKLSLSVLNTPTGTAKVMISVFLYAPRGDSISVNGKCFLDDARLAITTPAATSSAEEATASIDDKTVAVENGIFTDYVVNDNSALTAISD